MSKGRRGEITLLLESVRGGDERARSQLAEIVYDQLLAMAQRVTRGNANPSTLHPTALVNEAFVHLLETEVFEKAPDRRYFFATAGRAMRQILADHARRKNAAKRGGGYVRVALDQVVAYLDEQKIDTIELTDALEELERRNPRQAEVVHLRFFGGFTMPEIAEQIGVSLGTVELDWRAARKFLRLRMV